MMYDIFVQENMIILFSGPGKGRLSFQQGKPHAAYNLGQNKMEQQTPTPPPPQIKDEAARRAKTRHFPMIWGGGGGGRGGQGFPFILSKVVARFRGSSWNSNFIREYVGINKQYYVLKIFEI